MNGVLDWSVGRAMGRQLGTSMAQKKNFGRGKGSSTWLELGGFRSAVHGASVRRVTIIFIRIIIKSNVGEKKFRKNYILMNYSLRYFLFTVFKFKNRLLDDKYSKIELILVLEILNSSGHGRPLRGRVRTQEGSIIQFQL